MAIAFGSLKTSGNGGTTTITTASVLPTSTNLTLFCFFSRDNTNANPTVSGCNVTWTKAGTFSNEMQVYYAIGGSPTSGSISVSSLTSATENFWFVCDFSGTATTTPIKQTKYATGSSASLAVTLDSSITAGNTAFGFGMRSSGTATYTPGTNFTEIGEAASSGRSGATEYQLNKTDDAVIDMTASSSGGWAMGGFEISAGAESSGNFFLMFD